MSWLICPYGNCKGMKKKLPKNPWKSKVWKKRRSEILLMRSACEWCGNRSRLQIAHKERIFSRSDANYEKYLEMPLEDIRVLCQSCHMAHHKHLDLCPNCHGWKQERSIICFKCLPEKDKVIESRYYNKYKNIEKRGIV